MTNEGQENSNNGGQQYNIPGSIADLGDMLKGIKGAQDIMQEVAQDALTSGVITEIKQTDLSNNSQQQAAPKTAENVINEPIVDGAQNPQIAPENPGAKTDEEVIEDDIVDPILGSVKTKVKKSDYVDNFDQFKELSKKELGVEIADFKGLQRFIETSAKKWRMDSQKVAEVQSQVQQYESMFDNMPSEMLDGIRAFFEGRSDWKQSIVNTSTLDFRKSVDEIKTRDLIDHYFPGEFTEEDFSAEEKPKALTLAEKAAKDKFSIEKKGREEKSASELKAAQARLEAKKASITSSFASLKESFPNLDNSLEKQVKSIMESGDINSIFYNKDGSFKPNAAESLMMAIKGNETIKKLVAIASKQSESKTNEEILTRASDNRKPASGGSGGAEDAGHAKIKNEIDQLLSGVNKKKTY